MPMIQGIDGMALINALRQGREDRFQNDARQLQMAQARADAERQQQINGVLGNLFTPEAPSQGVAGNYASPAPKPSFDQAFGADTEKALVSGGALPSLSPAPAAPTPTSAGPRSWSSRINPEAFGQLMILDPERATGIATTLGKMDEMQVKQFQQRNDTMGVVAYHLSKVPLAQRPAELQRLAPTLLQAGWTEEEIRGADLSDQGLRGYQFVASDIDKVIEQDLAERKFRAGDNVPLVPGGGLANVRPEFDAQGNFVGNRATTVIEPFGGTGGESGTSGAAPGSIPRPASKSEYDQLPPGTQYLAPDGTVRTKGGSSGNATGGFQAGG